MTDDSAPRVSGISRRTALKAGVVGGLALPLADYLARFPARAATTDAALADPTLPAIVPLPSSVRGVRRPVIDLGGTWSYSAAPPAQFWTVGDTSGWAQIIVPGEPAMQGQSVPYDAECAYRTTIAVPSDYAGQRVLLRFDGVYSYARVWVDGTLVRDHDGGFTTWYADITQYVTPGKTARLTVGVTDRSSTIAGASAYAHHNIGGILRDVTLVAVPPVHLAAVHTSTTFDDRFVDATLHVDVAAVFTGAEPAQVQLVLTDPSGKVHPDKPRLTLSAGQPQTGVDIPVSAPAKWDAEHPNLYTLTTTLVSGSARETVSQHVGFRQVQISGNQLLVNGKAVHLRGVDHHHVSATLGRSTTADLDEQDIRLFQDANVNFFRTSHYPPTPALLAAADRLGLYIEVEAPVCFQYGTVDDPAYHDQYLSQFTEMIERDRDHACVIEWSLGNESGYGSNFAAENVYAHSVDTSRPTVFEDAAQLNGGTQADIYSGHYPQWNGPMGNPSQPIQYGEFAHCPNYDLGTLRGDPGVHDFWGQSIARFGTAFHAANGVVGGSIWAGVDDIFELDSGVVGYGEWGLIDIWRRRKPEHWLTKKGFSPIRIDDQPLTGMRSGSAIAVPVGNWYDFTNLGELHVDWSLNERSGRLRQVDIAPQTQGTLQIPAQPWQQGDVLNLRFSTAAGDLVDEFNLPLGAAKRPAPQPPGGTRPTIAASASQIQVSGVDAPFTVTFDTTTGQITDASVDGQTLILGGPDLDLGGAALGQWTLTSITTSTRSHEVVVTIKGSYGTVEVQFDVAISGDGLITTTYTIANPPAAPVDGYKRVGLSYGLVSGIDTLAWQRDGQWSAYPDDHIGRNEGVASKLRPGRPDAYRVKPSWPWSQDMRDYYLFGKDGDPNWTNDFRSLKGNIRTAAATIGSAGIGVRAESAGADAVLLTTFSAPRVDDADPRVSYQGSWTHADASSGYSIGDYNDTESFSNTTGDYAEFAFQGIGVKFVSAYSFNLGVVDIYVDGVLDASLDLYNANKNPDQVVYTKTGLAAGPHTIRVVVSGRKNPASASTYVLVDAFEPIAAGPTPSIVLQVVNQWNYPDIVWGNYVKPAITLPAGYSASTRLRLLGKRRG